MTQTNTLPQSQNEAWGFFGTIGHYAEPTAAWNLALQAIADATGCAPDSVRAFLDSPHGRHFADHVYGRMDETAASNAPAIAATVADWMGWRISRPTGRRYGIPAGLPYLTGFVFLAEIEADLADD
jgi:hypothetical protein